MTEKQRQIAIGTLLGDGWLQRASLRIKQCKEHVDYVFWLHKQLGNLCKSVPKQRKDNYQWYFQTRSIPEIEELRKQFYPKGKKVVPSKIEELLKTPLSLAIWFMDDGTLDWRPKDHYAFRFATNCFSIIECKKLVEVLAKNFGIVATVQTTLIRGKRYPRIYIGKLGRERFRELIKPHIVNCFSYKLPPISNPSETVLL